MEKFKAGLAAVAPILERLRVVLQGIWLFILYAAFSTLVLFSLSAFQLQNEIRSFKTADGRSLAIWRVLHEQTEWKAAKKELDTISANIATISQQNTARREEIIIAQKEIIESEQECLRMISDFEIKYVPRVGLGTPNVPDSERCGDLYFTMFVLPVEASEQNKAALAAAKAELKNQLNTFKKHSNYGKYLQNAIDATNARIKDLRENKSKIIEDIKKIASIDGAPEGGIGDFLNSLSYLQERETGEENYGILPDFSQMPSDMLTLILVMAMGALGGTMHLTRIYFLNRTSSSGRAVETTASYYLFRPLLGAITALSVFILAKAGVLVITIQSGTSDGASLSPFFVSFLGIISGLLAEQALDTIQGVGSRWFTSSSQADRPRWAYRLSEYLQLSSSDPAAMSDTDAAAVNKLATALNVPEDMVLDWLNERERVSPEYQKLVAVYLQLPVRKIFSDLPI